MTVKPIVAAIDGSAEALRAVGWAVREAVLRGAPLRIVSDAAEAAAVTDGVRGAWSAAEGLEFEE